MRRSLEPLLLSFVLAAAGCASPDTRPTTSPVSSAPSREQKGSIQKPPVDKAKLVAHQILKGLGEIKNLDCGPHIAHIYFKDGRRLITGRDFLEEGITDYVTVSD